VHLQKTRNVLVRVCSRDEPTTITAKVDEHLLLRFRREAPAASFERVVFPALGRSIELPRLGEVTLELSLKEGHYEFTCEQGVLRGVLVVG
jgi:plastocyanin domain-containing protein